MTKHTECERMPKLRDLLIADISGIVRGHKNVFILVCFDSTALQTFAYIILTAVCFAEFQTQ